jgi:hypothetical protein
MVSRPVHAAASGRRMKVLQRKNRPDSEESGGSPYASSCLCADPAGRTLDVRLASSGIRLPLYAGEKGKVKPFLRASNLDGFVKSRHPGESRGPVLLNHLIFLDTGFRRYDVRG